MADLPQFHLLNGWPSTNHPSQLVGHLPPNPHKNVPQLSPTTASSPSRFKVWASLTSWWLDNKLKFSNSLSPCSLAWSRQSWTSLNNSCALAQFLPTTKWYLSALWSKRWLEEQILPTIKSICFQDPNEISTCPVWGKLWCQMMQEKGYPGESLQPTKSRIQITSNNEYALLLRMNYDQFLPSVMNRIG